jgi:hypothetical protein
LRSSATVGATVALGAWLSLWLIHRRPAPFTGSRSHRVRAAHERSRWVANTGAQCWKACWGQPLKSSNLLSSAQVTCGNAPISHCQNCLDVEIFLSFWPRNSWSAGLSRSTPEYGSVRGCALRRLLRNCLPGRSGQGVAAALVMTTATAITIPPIQGVWRTPG